MPAQPFRDNVFIRLEDETFTTASGLVFPSLVKSGAKRTRVGRVVASGPGYWREPSHGNPKGVFVPNSLRAGDRVLVDAQAGENYHKGFFAPRHNGRGAELAQWGDTRGEFRIVREDEVLAVLED